MGKKKKKSKQAGNSLSTRLAAALQAGDPAGLDVPAGLTADAFSAAFAKAAELASKGPDPRELAALPEIFQLAFLHMAAEEQDDDQLNDLAAMSESKEVKKEARRILHRLQSQGVNVEIPEHEGSSVLERVHEESSHKPLPCFVTPVNGQGLQMIWLARYTRGGVAVYQAELHASEGLTEFGGGTIGRNRYKQLAAEMAKDDTSLLVNLEFAEARAMLAASAERSRASGRSLPDGYLEASGDLGPVQDSLKPADPASLFSPDSLQDVDSASAVELLELPEFADWLPDEDTVRALDEKIREAEQNQVVINEQQRVDLVAKAMDQAVADLLDGLEKRLDYQNRLLTQAAVYLRLNRPQDARKAAVIAWSLTREDFDPNASPFFDRLVKKSFLSAEEIVRHMSPPKADGDKKNSESDDGMIVTD